MSLFNDELEMSQDDLEYEFGDEDIERKEEDCEYEESDMDHPLAGMIYNALVRSGYDRCEALSMVYQFSDAYVTSCEVFNAALSEVATALGSRATTVEELERFLWGASETDDREFDEVHPIDEDEETMGLTPEEINIVILFQESFEALLMLQKENPLIVQKAARAFQAMGASPETAYELALRYARFYNESFRLREIALKAALSVLGQNSPENETKFYQLFSESEE
jgi:hypothetical protein